MAPKKLLPAILILFAALAPLVQAQATQPAHRALIISIDGLRPDLLLRADTPVLRDLMRHGAYSMWAQTTAVSVTIPSHISMLTGVKPQKHKIEWNYDLPLAKPVYPAFPTIFEIAHNAGMTTGMVAGKDKFSLLNKPGTISFIFLPTETVVTDEVVTSEALKMIRDDAPQVLFIHLPATDTLGHAVGWGSDAQIKTIEGADADIGQILNALKEKRLLDQTLVIVTADHGGAGRTHGADDPRSRHIPWIASGPGVAANYDLTRNADLTVHTEDTFATVCAFLNLPLGQNLDGKPVAAIFDQSGKELLQPGK